MSIFDATTFLDGLRGTNNELLVALKHNAAICRVTSVDYEYVTGNDQWVLRLHLQKQDFTPSMEVGIYNMTADQIAEQRARRILLNENPSRDTNDWNQATAEVFSRGLQTALQATGSPFPAIYPALRQQSTDISRSRMGDGRHDA